MSDLLTKEKKEHTTIDEKNPLHCVSYLQTWENYHRMNKELYNHKIWKLDASKFAILMIVGTAFMAANKLQLLGWITYCAAILLLVGIPLIWRHNLRVQFQSANVESDKEWNYLFYKDSFKLESRNTAAERKYSDLYQIVEGTEYIYLLPEMNRVLPVPRDNGERDKFLLSQGKQREKDRISPVLCCFYVLSGIFTAFFGITEERLPNQWLLQTWVYVICAAMPLVWMITIVLAGVSWNRYSISSVRNTGGRIVLRVLSVLLCCLIILGLGLWDFLFILGRYPMKQNDNGTYTEHVDDSYTPFEYYLYQSEGSFFLRYLRPMTDSRDTDPTISESEWYHRIDSDNSMDTGSNTTEPAENSGAFDTASQGSESEHNRNVALKIFDEYFAAKGSIFKESYTAKGGMYFVLNESDSDISYLQYDRDSQNGKCGLYVLFKASKSLDGSWSPNDAQMQNTYAYEYSTGAIVESGKTDWSDTGSKEYQKLTGEP
ncbi:YcxB family protein [Streptococcus canis]|uniref:YcxB family protein n=1 Tax=Streptococcus canis TaxID=1329 RepID=UPI0012E73F6B|nr:YcxB family protein [Streptococcus canis]QJD12585.1 YcxB family protein [Streptococcus canis]